MHCAFCLFFFPFLAANSLFSGTQRVDNEKERTNVNIEHNLVVLNFETNEMKAKLLINCEEMNCFFFFLFCRRLNSFFLSGFVLWWPDRSVRLTWLATKVFIR